MDDAIAVVKARVEELEQYRERLIAEANAELQRVAGGLAELRRLLEPPKPEPTEQAQEEVRAA